MAPVRTKRIALVSTTIPNFKRHKGGGGGGGGSNSDIRLEPSADVSEGAQPGDIIATIVTVPAGGTLELVDDAGGRFDIVGTDLVVGTTPFDYETATSHIVVIRTTAGANAFDKPITVTVINAVELTDITLSAATLAENSVAGTVVGTLASVPSGATFGLLDNAGNRFAVSGSNLVAGSVPTNYEAAASHAVEVLASRGGETLTETFTISIGNVAELTGISLSANTTPEDSVAPAVVGTLSSVPAGATWTLPGNAGNRFALSGNNIVRGATALDYETATTHQITVRGARGGETLDQVFTINVSNINEISNITLSAASVEENTGPGVTIGALASVPAGATLTLTNTAGNRFALSGANLVTGTVSTNYEAATSHDVTVQAAAGADTFSKTFTINVTDVVEGFTILLSSASVPENSASGVVVGALTSNPTGATYTLTNDAGGRFALSGSNIVTGATATNFEGASSHQIEVQGTRDGTVVDQTFTITVTDVDEISNITLSAASISEGAAAGAVVGALTSTPAGATWSLTDTAGNRFAITGNNLVRGATALDYETATSHSVTVRGTIGGETFDRTFTITVTDVDEISDITLATPTTPENSVAPTVVGALSSTPAGATWQLTDNAGGRFALSGNNIIRGATALDYETATTHNITVRGTRLNETLDKVIAIGVTNVNEIDDITLSAASISEGAAQGAAVGTLTSTPSGATFALTDSAGNRFALSGGNQIVRGATALDYEASQSHVVTVSATIGADVITRNFTIAVTNVAELQAINLSNNTIAENSAASTVVGTLSSTPAGATWTLLDGAGGRFTISGNNIVSTAPFDYEAINQFTINVQGDNGGETRTQIFTINVTNVVELSTISLSNTTVAEDLAQGATVGTLSSTPAGATWTLLDGASGRFTISGNNVVRGTTALDYEVATSHTINIQGSRGGETTSQVFTIIVTDVDEVNDITLSNASVAENIGQGATVGTLASNPAGATFSMVDSAGSRFAISGNSLVRGTTALDYETATSHSITIRATRLGETYDEAFTITVTNVDELTGIALSSNSIPENSAPGTNVGTLSSTPPGASFSLTDDAGGRFALSGANVVAGSTNLDYETATSHNITVFATLGADTESQSFTINVTDVNEAPPVMTPNNLGPNPGNNSTFGSGATAPTTTATTCNTNGSGSGAPYTFSWTLDSGNAVINSPNSQSTTFSAGPATKGAGTQTSIARCTVTDSSGAQGSTTTQIQITWS